MIDLCRLKSPIWLYGALKSSPSSLFFLQYLVQLASMKGRKCECSSLLGWSGWRERDSQTQRLLKNALDSPQQSGWGSSFSCPQVLLLPSWERCFGDPSGTVCGPVSFQTVLCHWLSLKSHLSSSPFARESTRCYSMGFSLLISAFLTHSHKNGRTQHVIPLCPQLTLCSTFLDAAINIFAIFAFLADKNPRFPICCLLRWLYGSNEGQQPRVWTQILLLILVSRASSFCFLQKNHWVWPASSVHLTRPDPWGRLSCWGECQEIQRLAMLVWVTKWIPVMRGRKPSHSQPQCAEGSAWRFPHRDACGGSVFTGYPTSSWRIRKYLNY